MGRENKDKEGLKWSDKVKFHPWIGENYKNGVVGYDENGIIQYGESEGEGKKILVLGESHYCYDESEAIPELTQEIIKDLIDPDSEWEPYKNTYTKFIKSLTGYIEELLFEDKEKAWQHVAFYNYVQFPISGARIAPVREDFKNSEEAFWEIIEKLQPNLVIVWGSRLYNNLPIGGEQINDLEVKYDNEDYEIELWSYSYNEENITYLLRIVHPSAGYSMSLWHEAIKVFIKRFDTK